MANENKGDKKPELKYDWNILGYAQVAAEYLNQGTDEGVNFAQKSLELILRDAKISDPALIKTVTDPEVIHKTIENYLTVYRQFKVDQTVGDLITQYSNDISKYLGESAEGAKKELEGFKDEKYSDIIKKIDDSNDILKMKKKDNKRIKISDEDVSGAEKTMKKYQKLIQTFSKIERLYLSEFRLKVEKEDAKDSLKEMYKPQEEQEERMAA
jgi:hypothetical protein